MNGPTGTIDNDSGKLIDIGRDPERLARSLYWRGWTVTAIARELDVPRPTVASWKKRGKWESAEPIQIIEDQIEAQVATLLGKGAAMTEGDMKRIDFIMRQLERCARVRKYMETGKEGDLNPKIANRNDEPAKAKRAEKRKNFLTEEQWDALEADFEANLYKHQELWRANVEQRTRKILKSRVGSSRVDLQACKLEYSIVSPK